MTSTEDANHSSDINDGGQAGTLEKLGLTKLEAKIYTGLLQYGASKARNLSLEIGLNRVDTYRVLRRLISHGLVSITLNHPTLYEAVNPRSAIGMLVEEAERKIREIRESAPFAVSRLQNLERKDIHSNNDPLKFKFKLLRGEAVMVKLDEMLLKARRSVIGIWSLRNISYRGLPAPLTKCRERGVTVQILCQIEREHIPILRELVTLAEVRHHNDLEGAARFSTIDSRELILSASSAGTKKKDLLALWSNRHELVEGLSKSFQSLWNEAMDYSEMIAYLKTL